jgi:deferrochelatase/peroxidase EfeB
LKEETSSWAYRHDRDLTGFVDGSENPTLLDAPADAFLPDVFGHLFLEALVGAPSGGEVRDANEEASQEFH